MSYIIKGSSTLISTKLTDAGRRKLSQGNFNISYFQIGDSEIYYNDIPNFSYPDCNVLSAAYNAQNKTNAPETNKGNVKYPFYFGNKGSTTYGIPINAAQIVPLQESVDPKGFFEGGPGAWSVNIGSAYTKNTEYIVDVCNNCSTNTIILSADPCGTQAQAIQAGDFVTIVFNGTGDCPDLDSGTPPPILTYGVLAAGGNSVTLDRPIPSFCDDCCPPGGHAYGRLYVYPAQTSATTISNCDPSVNSFRDLCNYVDIDPAFWNMNIPWKVDPAGLIAGTYEDYSMFGSIHYIGTMEYLGYGESSGQTFAGSSYPGELTDTWFQNSFDESVYVLPEEQKCVAIVHFTNGAIDTYYGEKLDGLTFKISVPTIMWHKNPASTLGETFSTGGGIKYMKSTPNPDMNDPGLRYYHLFDDYGNRVGKLFPDLKIAVFDDEEIVAALSYKSNRNWTLPAPKVTSVAAVGSSGLITSSDQVLWVTWRFNSLNSQNFTNSLHCNYYVKSTGTDPCSPSALGDMAVQFGNSSEFGFLKGCCFNGYYAEEFYVLAQVVTGTTTLPDTTLWKMIDFTSQVNPSPNITAGSMVGNQFIITKTLYDAAPYYDLGPILSLPAPGQTDLLGFGDEYYFYGNIETGIMATIYEMRYRINLGSGTFKTSSNPTWVSGDTYITEVGLFDAEKDLMITSKFQSPILRQGSQQISISLDF